MIQTVYVIIDYINLKFGGEGMLDNIDKYMLLSITQDFMKAEIMVINPSFAGEEEAKTLKKCGKDLVMKKLRENGVVKGINASKIKEIFDKEIYEKDIVIAEGTYPVKGKDGYLIYNFELNSAAHPTLLDDGSVDFKNLNIVKNVEKDTLLVTLVPKEQSQDGFNIKGEIVKAEPSKDCIMPVGKNTRLSEDGLRLYSTEEGNVEFIDGKICISNMLVIEGDVGTATGDIYFKGDVDIKGCILSGFKVEAAGSVTVDDFVEAAIIDAGADIVLRKGVNGSGKGQLRAGGNVLAKFVEAVNIKAGGDVIINSVMNSDIECDGNVIVEGKRGYIIGGRTHANNSVRARVIGNKAEIPTIIEVGYIQEYKKKQVELSERMEYLSNKIAALVKDIRDNISSEKKVELLREKINMEAEYNSAGKQFEELKRVSELNLEGKVSVFKAVYPKVKIYIGEAEYTVKDMITQTTFKKVGKAVIKYPWEEK